MTLEELNQALIKLHLNLDSQSGMEVRDKILALHGQSILKTRAMRCKNCWLKEHGKCSEKCSMFLESNNPVEVSKNYLSKPNYINLFPFLYLYMIPVYEEITGNKDTMRQLGKEFKRQWKKEHGSIDELPNYL